MSLETARSFADDVTLRRWIRREWLDPRAVHELVISRDYITWVSVDDFFEVEALEALLEHHASLEYVADDVGLPYDSEAVRVDSDTTSRALELLLHPVWHTYAAVVIGATLRNPGRTVVKFRSHAPGARGFWLHTDRDPEHPKALAVLGYLNPGWLAEHGGLLQLWSTRSPTDPNAAVIRHADFIGKPLAFLEQRTEMTIEAATEHGVELLEARLVEQIVPRLNRVVFLDFQSCPSFHSITPSHGRRRNAFLQWLY